jgi:hypothetical protein
MKATYELEADNRYHSKKFQINKSYLDNFDIIVYTNFGYT